MVRDVQDVQEGSHVVLEELRRALAKSDIHPRKVMGVLDAVFAQFAPGPEGLADC